MPLSEPTGGLACVYRETGVWHGTSRATLAAVAVPVASGVWIPSVHVRPLCFYHDQTHQWRDA
eukprot:2391700-Pleurochrysis_carterae.AAC.1